MCCAVSHACRAMECVFRAFLACSLCKKVHALVFGMLFRFLSARQYNTHVYTRNYKITKEVWIYNIFYTAHAANQNQCAISGSLFTRSLSKFVDVPMNVWLPWSVYKSEIDLCLNLCIVNQKKPHGFVLSHKLWLCRTELLSVTFENATIKSRTINTKEKL